MVIGNAEGIELVAETGFRCCGLLLQGLPTCLGISLGLDRPKFLGFGSGALLF